MCLPCENETAPNTCTESQSDASSAIQHRGGTKHDKIISPRIKLLRLEIKLIRPK